MSSVINLDIAKRVDIVCRKGDSMTFTITMTNSDGTPMNLHEYDIDLEVRTADTDDSADSPGPKLTLSYASYTDGSTTGEGLYNTNAKAFVSGSASATPNAVPGDGVYLKSSDGDATVWQEGGDNSSFDIIVVSSSAVNFSGIYVYDLQATDPSSNVSTWLYGTFKVNEDVTV